MKLSVRANNTSVCGLVRDSQALIDVFSQRWLKSKQNNTPPNCAGNKCSFPPRLQKDKCVGGRGGGSPPLATGEEKEDKKSEIRSTGKMTDKQQKKKRLSSSVSQLVGLDPKWVAKVFRLGPSFVFFFLNQGF